jgi:hypothetical protein
MLGMLSSVMGGGGFSGSSSATATAEGKSATGELTLAVGGGDFNFGGKSIDKAVPYIVIAIVIYVVMRYK